MLINEAASILLFAATHICSRAKESSRLPCQTSALHNLDNKPDRCFRRSEQSLRTACEMFYRNSFDLSWTLLMMWKDKVDSLCVGSCAVLPACLWWGCDFWPWWLLPCCRKRAAPFTMKKLSLRLQNKDRGVQNHWNTLDGRQTAQPTCVSLFCKQQSRTLDKCNI